MHLQNVIEDALDMSRIENKKFTIFKEVFDIRGAIAEVSDIMKFQFEQKKLEMKITVSTKVPQLVLSD